MKKFITLLFAVGALTTSAFSQSKAEESRRVILGKEGGSTANKDRERNSDGSVIDKILGRGSRDNDTRYPDGTNGSREAQIDQVNREYDAKIASIRNNPNLSTEEKQRIIRRLEAERAQKIRDINRRYDGSDRDDDDYNDDKRYKRKGNGKKLGWEKGVGNPHREGSGKDFGYEKNKARNSDDRYDDDRDDSNDNYQKGKGNSKMKANGKGNGKGNGNGKGKKG